MTPSLRNWSFFTNVTSGEERGDEREGEERHRVERSGAYPSGVVDEELLHRGHADQKSEPKVILGADGDTVILEILVLDQEVICYG